MDGVSPSHTLFIFVLYYTVHYAATVSISVDTMHTQSMFIGHCIHHVVFLWCVMLTRWSLLRLHTHNNKCRTWAGDRPGAYVSIHVSLHRSGKWSVNHNVYSWLRTVLGCICDHNQWYICPCYAYNILQGLTYICKCVKLYITQHNTQSVTLK